MTNEIVITPTIQCSIEVVPTVSTNVQVSPQGEFAVQIVEQTPVVVDFGLTNIGLKGDKGDTGPVGPPGPNEIGGFPVAVSGAQENDTLLLKSWEWRNTPQEALTDGGNF